MERQPPDPIRLREIAAFLDDSSLGLHAQRLIILEELAELQPHSPQDQGPAAPNTAFGSALTAMNRYLLASERYADHLRYLAVMEEDRLARESDHRN